MSLTPPSETDPLHRLQSQRRYAASVDIPSDPNAVLSAGQNKNCANVESSLLGRRTYCKFLVVGLMGLGLGAWLSRRAQSEAEIRAELLKNHQQYIDPVRWKNEVMGPLTCLENDFHLDQRALRMHPDRQAALQERLRLLEHLRRKFSEHDAVMRDLLTRAPDDLRSVLARRLTDLEDVLQERNGRLVCLRAAYHLAAK